ncbi:immunoglobulin-like domain-containing receptor 2 [Clarias gariepinus]|uniref:immunoglobulin-like domain-containing receptor 2 n=1 Tax=Clarias gariepinus TaxID=13013 RepID=UPI00234D0878|nr:immunoglobulin-like domain-containing receptor 2 [Clarias gariepinus]
MPPFEGAEWERAMPRCEAVQVSVREGRRFALLSQPVVLSCQYTSTSTRTPVVQWWYKSYCHDSSFPDSLEVRGSELGPSSDKDCSDANRTVRIVASGQGSSLFIAKYCKERDISIIKQADLRIGEVRWGDSGIYYCRVVFADDLEGLNEGHVELLVYAFMKIGSTAGIIGGCAAVLLLLVVVICCCCWWKKKKSEERPEEGGYTDKGQHEFEELQEKRDESQPRDEDDRREDPQGRADNCLYKSDNYDNRRSERYDDKPSDRYDDRRADRYDDQRND